MRRRDESSCACPVDRQPGFGNRNTQGSSDIGDTQFLRERRDEQGVQGGLVEPTQSVDQRELGRPGRRLRPADRDRVHQKRQSCGVMQQIVGDWQWTQGNTWPVSFDGHRQIAHVLPGLGGHHDRGLGVRDAFGETQQFFPGQQVSVVDNQRRGGWIAGAGRARQHGQSPAAQRAADGAENGGFAGSDAAADEQLGRARRRLGEVLDGLVCDWGQVEGSHWWVINHPRNPDLPPNVQPPNDASGQVGCAPITWRVLADSIFARQDDRGEKVPDGKRVA